MSARNNRWRFMKNENYSAFVGKFPSVTMMSPKKILLYIIIPAACALVLAGGITWLVIYLKSRDTTSNPANALDPGRKKLVIDHDGGADDAMAITMSLLYEKYFGGPYLIALTTTHGNTNQSQVEINSARILELSGREDVPIYHGAVGPLVDGIESDIYFGHDGLGDDGYTRDTPVKVQDVHAAIGLIQLSKKYEGELIVMSIGPLTNIALALRLDPDFINRLAHLYVGAGHVYSPTHLKPEFNAHMDVEAYYIMAEKASVEKVTVVPFSQVESLSFAKEWRFNVLGAIPTPTMQALLSFERIANAKPGDEFLNLDPAVAAIVLDQKVITDYKTSNNSITLCGENRGINTNDFNSTEPNVGLFYSGDVEYYKQMLMNIYTAELKDNNA